MIGRTARIGNEGLASSFYNEDDQELALDLVNIFLESGQKIPDFLESYKPVDNKIDFQDDTDDEDNGDGNTGDDAGAAWGGIQMDDNDAGNAPQASDTDWGF